jgi:hypothetical protein
MSIFQGKIIEPENSRRNQYSENFGLKLARISLFLIFVSFFAGIGMSNSRIDASWKLPKFNTVEVNKNFQYSTSLTGDCVESATAGCVVFRFVSKFDCNQVTGLIALVDSSAKEITSLSSAKSDIFRGTPFEITFNLPENSQDVADTNLLDVRCYR